MRLILPVQLILLGIAALNRFVQIFEDTNSDVYTIIFTSSTVLYVLSIIVCLLLTVIVAIVRFYQGMYTNEGYLSHTLPVTPAQHIFSKLIVSLLFEMGSLLAVFLSLCIITFGEFNIELFKAGFFLLGKAHEAYGINITFYILEFIIYAIVAASASLLKLYLCISIGQLVSKKKVLLAFGVFFGIYFIKQILGTIFIIFITLNPSFMEDLGKTILENTTVFYHIALCSSIVISAVIGGLYFLFSRLIMSKKLNLS